MLQSSTATFLELFSIHSPTVESSTAYFNDKKSELHSDHSFCFVLQDITLSDEHSTEYAYHHPFGASH